jgi:DNA-binding MarR family transcriptional regulator
LTLAFVADPPDPLALANELRPVLLRLSRRIRREVHASGFTAGRLSLLGTIELRPGIGVGELAEQEAVSAPRISKAVEELVGLGLVGREPGVDRRRVGLTVTAEGKALLRSVRKRRTAWLAERLDGLGEDDVRAIAAAVEPLTRLGER